MQEINDINKELKDKADSRFDNFQIEEISSIKRIDENSYLESPIWVGGDQEFVCLFVDLDNSSKMSYKKHPKTMAKIYDYFTQTLVDVLSHDDVKADYIDIKGDGAFGIFEGEDAAFRALSASLTFGTFFKKHIRPKFQDRDSIFNFKASISADKVLVKKIGRRGTRNNNEVWAGRLINSASKIASASKDIYETDPGFDPAKMSTLVISGKVYEMLKAKNEFAIMHCGHDTSGKEVAASQLWREYDTKADSDVNENIVYYAPGLWCDICQDKVNEGLLS